MLTVVCLHGACPLHMEIQNIQNCYPNVGKMTFTLYIPSFSPCAFTVLQNKDQLLHFPAIWICAMSQITEDTYWSHLLLCLKARVSITFQDRRAEGHRKTQIYIPKSCSDCLMQTDQPKTSNIYDAPDLSKCGEENKWSTQESKKVSEYSSGWVS